MKLRASLKEKTEVLLLHQRQNKSSLILLQDPLIILPIIMIVQHRLQLVLAESILKNLQRDHLLQVSIIQITEILSVKRKLILLEKRKNYQFMIRMMSLVLELIFQLNIVIQELKFLWVKVEK